MDSKVVEVWRLRWPKAIPEHEYETALMLGELFSAAAPKPAPPPQAEQPRDLISIREAGKLLNLVADSIYNRIKAGSLKSYGSHPKRVSRADVERLRGGPQLVRSLPDGSAEVSSSVGLTPKEVAKEMGLKVQYVYAAIRRGNLKATTKGKGPTSGLLIMRPDLDAYRATLAAIP